MTEAEIERIRFDADLGRRGWASSETNGRLLARHITDLLAERAKLVKLREAMTKLAILSNERSVAYTEALQAVLTALENASS